MLQMFDQLHEIPLHNVIWIGLHPHPACQDQADVQRHNGWFQEKGWILTPTDYRQQAAVWRSYAHFVILPSPNNHNLSSAPESPTNINVARLGPPFALPCPHVSWSGSLCRFGIKITGEDHFLAGGVPWQLTDPTKPSIDNLHQWTYDTLVLGKIWVMT